MAAAATNRHNNKDADKDEAKAQEDHAARMVIKGKPQKMAVRLHADTASEQ